MKKFQELLIGAKKFNTKTVFLIPIKFKEYGFGYEHH